MVIASKMGLSKAIKEGHLDRFIAEHEADPPADEGAFNATLRAMAGKSKEAPAASSPDDDGD